MECGEGAEGPHVYRCRNRGVSVRGLPVCGHVVHCECHRANDALFNTSWKGSIGLRGKPGDARPGYTCMVCRLQGVLGRELDLIADPLDAMLLECAIMYDIDITNSIVKGTARTYTQAASAYERWMETYMRTATYREVDVPRDPPALDRNLTFGCHQEYILCNEYTRGVASEGGPVVASTALARVHGFRHLGMPGGDIQRELSNSVEFKKLQTGISKRLLHNPVPKRTMTMPTYERWAARLGRRHQRARRRLRRAKAARAAPGGNTPANRRLVRALLLLVVSVLGELHLLHVQVFGYTRGRVPFSLKYGTWVRGLWTRRRCADYGVFDPDGQPMPHLRLLRDFHTKTHTSAWYEGVLAAVTASGHRLLDTAVSLRRALVEADLATGGLFYHKTGVPMTLHSWQVECLRPALRQMRDEGEPALRNETEAAIKSRWSSWSLRRLCETNFSSASRDIPTCPRDLKIGHSGWSAGKCLRGHISDRYRDWPLYMKVDATRLYA